MKRQACDLLALARQMISSMSDRCEDLQQEGVRLVAGIALGENAVVSFSRAARTLADAASSVDSALSGAHNIDDTVEVSDEGEH